MDPAMIPPGREHLDDEDRQRLLRLELLVAMNRFHDAQDVAEDLWLEAIDAHKRLYQGVSNGLTAVCAREGQQRRGAREIAARARKMLQPYPARALGFDLDAFVESVERFVERGSGAVVLLRQGGPGRRVR